MAIVVCDECSQDRDFVGQLCGLWHQFANTQYEAGFETSQPQHVVVPRRDIFAKSKEIQRLSSAAKQVMPMVNKAPKYGHTTVSGDYQNYPIQSSITNQYYNSANLPAN